MPRAFTVRNGWSSGEWSPFLLGRTDLDQYYRALQKAENFIVTPEGALVRRPPTRRLGPTKNTGNVRLVPFVPVSDVSIVIELGNQYARFWTQTGVIGGGTPVEVTTPWTTADLPDLAFAQDADVLYVVHPNYPPYKISRLGPSSFSCAAVAFLDGRAPLGPLNFNAGLTATITGTWPNLTITMSAALFIASDVGRVFFVRDTTNKRAYYVTINTVVSSTVANGTGTYRIGNANPAASTEWALGLFSSTRGCTSVTFHESRLWYGGFTSAPDVITGSVSNSFDNFESISPDTSLNESANADKAIVRRVTGNSVDTVRWMVSGSDLLLVGTTSGEFTVRPGVSGFLTPTEAVVRRATQRGSAPVAPIRVDGTVFFVQRGNTRLRQVKYDIETDSLITVDATLLASHLVETGIRHVTYQQSPYSVLWLLTQDDQLVGITVESDQKVLGAHRHRLGGGLRGRAPAVLDMACVPAIKTNFVGEPANQAQQDVLFLAVRRTQGGALQQTVEVMEPLPQAVTADAPQERQAYSVERAVYLDCQQSVGRQWRITAASEVGGHVVFTYSSNSPDIVANLEIVFRGLAWRKGQEIVSLTAGNREPFVVLSPNLTTRTFKVALPITPTVPLSLANFGLPAGSVLTTEIDFLPPLAGERLFSVTPPAAELGDTYDYAVDGRLLKSDSLADRPASFVVGGYPYRSEAVTMPIGLLTQQAPSDLGEPGNVHRVNLRVWASIGGFVEVAGSNRVEQIVTATTQNLMDAPPKPAYTDVSLPTAGTYDGDQALRIYTEDIYPLSLLALSALVDTKPR
jgi:hypothetical protein